MSLTAWQLTMLASIPRLLLADNTGETTRRWLQEDAGRRYSVQLPFLALTEWQGVFPSSAWAAGAWNAGEMQINALACGEGGLQACIW